MTDFENKNVVITGGTGSLGKTLLRRLLSGERGLPNRITVLSRDEAKQHQLRLSFLNRRVATEDIAYDKFNDLVRLVIGDVRNLHTVAGAVRGADVVFNAAALKQVPACEYAPGEAVATNIGGAENIMRAIRDLGADVGTVIGISTDKAVAPVNVMGMTKAVQEKIFIRANLDCPNTRFCVVRYGNVLASRGSVIPLFHDQIANGGPLTVTDPRMTRFLLSLDRAVDVIFAAYRHANPGETFIPVVPSAKITDVVAALVGERKIEVSITGIRPGEKLHEELVSEEESARTYKRNDHYVISPILPELASASPSSPALGRAFTSAVDTMTPDQVKALLVRNRLMPGDVDPGGDELLR